MIPFSDVGNEPTGEKTSSKISMYNKTQITRNQFPVFCHFE